jgi:two-component system cell cycle sensor histidine kinase/response regulator CckA
MNFSRVEIVYSNMWNCDNRYTLSRHKADPVAEREAMRILVVSAATFDCTRTAESLKLIHPLLEMYPVHTSDELLRALADGEWDFILAGYSNDGFGAIDALAALSTTTGAPPLIAIGGAIGEEAVAECIRAGAADFVRSEKLERLNQAVQREMQKCEPSRVIATSCHMAATLPQTVAETDMSGKLTFVNDNGFDMFGYDQSDFAAGLHVGQMFHPEDRDRALASVQRILSAQIMSSGEYLAVRKDGTTFHALINSAPLVHDGRAAGMQSIVVDISERVEAEEALKESELRYRSLVENMHEGVWAVNSEGVTTFVNDRMAKMLGYSPDEMVGRYLWEFHEQNSAQAARKSFAAAFGTDRRSHPRTLLTSTGEPRQVLLRPIPILDEDGELRSAFATVVDITQRVRIEQERQQALVKYRALFDQLSDAVFIHDLNGRFVEVNDAACTRLGYTRSEFLKMGLMELDQADYSREVSVRMRQLLEHGEAQFQTAHVTREGEINPVELKARVINYNGQPHVLSVARDISSRIEAERRFSTIFDVAGTAICIMSANGTITDINWNFRDLSGYETDEIIGAMSWSQFVAEHDAEKVLECTDLQREGGGSAPENYEFDFVNRAGTVIRVLSSIAMIPGTEDMVASLLDISEHRKLETQLRQAQKMNAIGQLAGGVAHDFNNNLTAIIGSVQLLRYEEGLSQTVEESMDVIEKAADRAASLTRQLLAFGSKQIMAPETLSVSELAMAMRPMLERVIPESILIETAYCGGDDLVCIDRSQLENVIMNLCMNARDAMSAGGVLAVGVYRVTLDAGELGSADLQPGEYLQISVSDNGVGMDEEARARVFEPFFTTKEGTGGTGLGLATAYGIVRQSGGDITVSSEPGSGSTFRILLPAAERTTEDVSPSLSVDCAEIRSRGTGT